MQRVWHVVHSKGQRRQLPERHARVRKSVPQGSGLHMRRQHSSYCGFPISGCGWLPGSLLGCVLLLQLLEVPCCTLCVLRVPAMTETATGTCTLGH